MSPEARLSPNDRRAILTLLSRDRLAELTTRFELEVSDRRSTRAHVDALVRKRSLDFRELLDLLRRDELQAACQVLGLDSGGREKSVLVQRIAGTVPQPTRAPLAPTPTDHPFSTPCRTPPPASARSEGALKSALRKFAVELAGGLRGRDASAAFVSQLLQCFGWPESGPAHANMPAVLSLVEHGQRATKSVALHWKERSVLLDVVKHDVQLDFAWKDLLRVCLQLEPTPQYVLLTNQRDLHLYDLARSGGREAPRLSTSLDDLAKHSEAFPFLAVDWAPGTAPKIVNSTKVSAEVADLVGRLYRGLKEQHPERERDVVQFTLQCILAMFAEDIGLLPKEYFTSILYEGAHANDVESRLAELFRLMSTRHVPGVRAVPFFNGGLFTTPVTLPLGAVQLAALTKASEANWTYVDPHIFGSVFQGIMSDAERHKSGAHYTAHDDIMRVVGPTIVDPWRLRIRAARSLTELLEVRRALFRFRVLDPACGSGNFLYVAFREMYRLDTELLGRIREFPSTHGDGRMKVTWGAGIQASNFFGIDINPFAVELAKVTLNIAKKIAYDERREQAAELGGQMELEVDPSLPLDNLEDNIVCADALFTEWPEVDAITGNPPFLGDRKIRGELGQDYLRKLQDASGFDGVVDLCCYWFRRTHDRLPPGARAGLVGTSGIRIGKAREASLDYVVANGGTITNAVSSRIWPGDAALNVSMVNWVKGSFDGERQLVIGDQVFAPRHIATHLQLHTDLSGTSDIAANAHGTAMGVIFGSENFRVDRRSFVSELVNDGVIRPIAAGTALLTGVLAEGPDYCVFLGDHNTEESAATAGKHAFVHLRQKLLPEVRGKGAMYQGWPERWWQPWRPRQEYFRNVGDRCRVIVCSNPQARPILAFLSTKFIPTNTLQVFAFDDDYSFGILQSSLHWEWTKAKGGRVTDRIRYTNEVWSTFPWPQESSESEVVAVATAARALRTTRDALMQANGWSLRQLHQAAEIAGPHPLKDAQSALDEAVRAAYGMPADMEATDFLLDLNKLVAQDEAEGRSVQGPGVPAGLDPRDARWMSEDCIEPPSV